MTMWEVTDANKYLRHNPPVHEMLGDWFGCRKKPDAEPEKRGNGDDLRKLARELNP